MNVHEPRADATWSILHGDGEELGPSPAVREDDVAVSVAHSSRGHNGEEPPDAKASNAPDDEASDELSAAEIVNWLVPDLKVTLASLDGAPESLALAVVQLLPFGSRASLISLGLARHQETEAPCAIVKLTPLAYEVMTAAALAAEADPDGVADWLQQARDAAQS